MSPQFTFWYKSKIEAKNLATAIRKEKSLKPKLSSIEQDDRPDQELTPAIGFTTYTENDYEE